MGGEEHQEVELFRRQLHHCIFQGHFPFFLVDRQIGKLQFLWFIVPGSGFLDRIHPADDRFDACHQFPQTEGFGDVVVCPQLQPEHLVKLLGLGREHQDRQLFFGLPDTFADLDPAQFGQHQVENHQHILVVQRPGEAISAIGGNIGNVPKVFQMNFQQIGDIRIVFDHQYFFVHGRLSPRFQITLC